MQLENDISKNDPLQLFPVFPLAERFQPSGFILLQNRKNSKLAEIPRSQQLHFEPVLRITQIILR